MYYEECNLNRVWMPRMPLPLHYMVMDNFFRLNFLSFFIFSEAEEFMNYGNVSYKMHISNDFLYTRRNAMA